MDIECLRRFLTDVAARKLSFPLASNLMMWMNHGSNAKNLPADKIAEYTLRTSERFRAPVEILPMWLELFPQDLRHRIQTAETSRFSATKVPSESYFAHMKATMDYSFQPRYQALLDSVGCIAKDSPLLPTMVAIHGVWTLATEMATEDIITAVADFCKGETTETNDGVKMLERVLFLAENTVERAVRAFHKAGIELIMLCDPAVSTVCFSPKMKNASSLALQKYCLYPLRHIKKIADELGIGFCLHACGELSPEIVRGFGSLEPLIFSAGCAVPQAMNGKEFMLWEMAPLIPKDVIIAGGAPTKLLGQISIEEFLNRRAPLRERMATTDRRWFEMSECDLPTPHDPVTLQKIWNAVEAWWPLQAA